MTLSGYVVLCSRDMGRRREIRDSSMPSREYDSLRRSHGFGMNFSIIKYQFSVSCHSTIVLPVLALKVRVTYVQDLMLFK